MTYTVIVDANAERDWHEAAIWYGKRDPGVGRRLNVAIQALLDSLARQPERFPLATARTRKARVPPPWPYSVYFTINNAHREVKVLAIWHGARNPAQLRRRLK